MKNLRGFLLVFLLSSACMAQAQQLKDPDLSEYDKDKDTLLSVHEQNTAILKEANAIFKKWDKNDSGQLESDEAAEYIKSLNDEAPNIKAQGRSFVKNNAAFLGVDVDQPVPVSVFREVIGTKDVKPEYQPGWFRLRGKVSDFPTQITQKSPIDKVNPATFSYSRDITSDADTWTARGAVGGYWQGSNFGYSLGAEFERVDTGAKNKPEVDSLTFRALVSEEYSSGLPSFVGAIAWRAGVDYATNFDFKGSLLGASMEIEPVWNVRAFTGLVPLVRGPGKSLQSSPTIGLRNFVRLETGGVVNDFENPSVPTEDYLRLGPQLEAVIWPFGTDQRLSLTASYGYFAELLGGGQDFHSFRAGADWKLDSQGKFVLRLEYIDGMVPLLLTEQNMLLISLGVRY